MSMCGDALTNGARLERMKGVGLVPVIRAESAPIALSLARALFEGGMTCLEIALTVPGGLSVIQTLRNEWQGDAVVGAGTVLSKESAAECLSSGAQFIVSPAHVPLLVETVKAKNALVMPGAATPSEILRAHEEGADLVKVFPVANLGGPSYLKSLSGPLPHIQLMPSGGIDLTNLREYLQAGAALVGLGGALADARLLASEGPGAITRLAARYVEARNSA